MTSYSNRWGRYYRKKRLVEDCTTLNADALKRVGVFKDGFCGSLCYTEEPGRQFAITSQRISDSNYLLRINDVHPVMAEFLSFPQGGGRYFLACPGCQARYSKLYKRPHDFGYKCRKCLKLAYSSTQNQRRPNRFLLSILRSAARETGMMLTPWIIKTALSGFLNPRRYRSGLDDYLRRKGELLSAQK